MLSLFFGNLSSFPSVLIADEGKPLYFLKSYVKYSHQENLISMVDSVWNLAGCSPERLKRLVIYEGPGLFTSLRIGYAFAKALFLKNPYYELYALNSLDVLALLSEKPCYIPCLPAQKGEVFYALYENGTRKSEYKIGKYDELKNTYSQCFLENFTDFPDAESLFKAFIKVYNTLKPQDPRTADPFYIRPPDAYMKLRDKR